MVDSKILRNLFLFLAVVSLGVSAAGCAGTPKMQAVNAQGEKVYLGPKDIENSQAFKNYLRSPRGEADKQRYLFERLKGAADLSFYHDGDWYNALEAYRGGMWLMRERYKKGQLTRDFIKKYVERSDAGNLHLVKYPDGSKQVGSYVLYNELDLLEEKAKNA